MTDTFEMTELVRGLRFNCASDNSLLKAMVLACRVYPRSDLSFEYRPAPELAGTNNNSNEVM